MISFGIFDIFSDWRLWMMIPVIAIMSYLMAQYYMRKVFVRVVYHRRGSTVDIMQCLEREDRITFKTVQDPVTRKKEEITVVKKANPEVQVAGLKTYKLYHVVEGFGETVEIRDIKKDSTSSGIPISTAFSAMGVAFDLMSRTASKGKSEWLIPVAIGLLCFFLGFGWGKALLILLL